MTVRMTNSNSRIDVLGEKDALSFDYEEVDKLLNVVQASLEGRLGDSVVFPGTHPGGETVVKQQLSGNLKGCGY